MTSTQHTTTRPKLGAPTPPTTRHRRLEALLDRAGRTDLNPTAAAFRLSEAPRPTVRVATAAR